MSARHKKDADDKLARPTGKRVVKLSQKLKDAAVSAKTVDENGVCASKPKPKRPPPKAMKINIEPISELRKKAEALAKAQVPGSAEVSSQESNSPAFGVLRDGLNTDDESDFFPTGVPSLKSPAKTTNFAKAVAHLIASEMVRFFCDKKHALITADGLHTSPIHPDPDTCELLGETFEIGDRIFADDKERPYLAEILAVCTTVEEGRTMLLKFGRKAVIPNHSEMESNQAENQQLLRNKVLCNRKEILTGHDSSGTGKPHVPSTSKATGKAKKTIDVHREVPKKKKEGDRTKVIKTIPLLGVSSSESGSSTEAVKGIPTIGKHFKGMGTESSRKHRLPSSPEEELENSSESVNRKTKKAKRNHEAGIPTIFESMEKEGHGPERLIKSKKYEYQIYRSGKCELFSHTGVYGFKHEILSLVSQARSRKHYATLLMMHLMGGEDGVRRYLDTQDPNGKRGIVKDHPKLVTAIAGYVGTIGTEILPDEKLNNLGQVLGTALSHAKATFRKECAAASTDI